MVRFSGFGIVSVVGAVVEVGMCKEKTKMLLLLLLLTMKGIVGIELE